MKIGELYNLFLQSTGVNTDTRKIEPGNMYFALRGEQFNGNLFVKQALDRGALYAVVDEPEAVINENCLLVSDTLATLQQLANFHRRQFTIPFIAITGSNGKTTTKELIQAVLRKKFKTQATKGNLNNHIGVPLTILSIPLSTQVAIIEMGANHQQEIDAYCKIAEPTHGLITNCGKAHLEGFGGEEGVRKGKGELFDFLRKIQGTIWRNADLDYLYTMATGIENQITYGEFEGKYRGKPSSQPNGCLSVALLTAGMETSLYTQLVGEYNLPNVLAAVAVGSTLGVPLADIREAIENYTPDNSRSQLVQHGSNTIILDAYNANPTSMQAAIRNFAQLPHSNKWVMLGAMKELGDSAAEEHESLIQLLHKLQFNQVVLVGEPFKSWAQTFHYFNHSVEAKDWFKNQDIKNAAILIKGSRAYAMEKVIE
jgi:UDP-N-acetylmuramoyl-tripeptide--D-alanyl-D-alanine ligase